MSWLPIDEARAREVLEQARCEAKDFQWSARISTQTAIRAMLALATEAAHPSDGAGMLVGCSCVVAFGQDEDCRVHGIGTAWRANHPEADMRAAPYGQGTATPPAPIDDLRAALEDLTRPLVGIENRTPEEVRDILFDRIRRKFAALSGERKA